MSPLLLKAVEQPGPRPGHSEGLVPCLPPAHMWSEGRCIFSPSPGPSVQKNLTCPCIREAAQWGEKGLSVRGLGIQMPILAPPFSRSLGRSLNLSEPQCLMGILVPQSQGRGQTRCQGLQPLSLPSPSPLSCSPPPNCTSHHRHPTREILLASSLESLSHLSWLQSAFG